jgi:predicted NACHT family NTPase
MAMQRDDEPVLSSSVRSLLPSRIEASRPLLTKKLKVLYQAQDTLPKLVEDASVPEQRMEDYHVKLQIVLNSQKEVQEKQPIVLFQMFEKVGDEDAAGHVLVMGVAGIGKTTFLNHMTYEWSQGNVFKETFETIFKIRLRSLLDDSLAQELSIEYTQEDRLAALIQRSIEQQQQELKTLRKAKSQVSSGSSVSAATIDSTESIDADVSAFSPFSLEEIKTADRTRAVLLLDGYDEIEHLNRGGHVVSDLLRSIFEYPNVVLTSRPNAVTSVLENRFERKIEAVGLADEGVSQYMDRYFDKESEGLIRNVEQGLQMMPPSRAGNIKFPLFQFYERQEDIQSKGVLATLEAIDKYAEEKGGRGLGETLEEIKTTIETYYTDVHHSLSILYRDNSLLRETLTTPINLAMICLIATDPNILRRFEGDFNVGQLYEGVVVWLGKRYLIKFKEKEARDTLDAIDIVDERILHLEELSVLEQAAYQEFKINRTLVSGKKVDTLARNINPRLGIRQVNKYGLIKPDMSKPLYDLEIYLYGVPEDQDIKTSKLCLYLNPEKKSLAYAAQKRGKIERVDLTPANGLSDIPK